MTTRFQYDGTALIAEYNGSNAVQRRYVHGPGIDNPIVWYDAGTISGSTRRFLMADERGSVVSITDSAGATININAYDEFGIPAPGNIGRFGYTGQTWLPEVGMWYYKARIYSPTLGQFMQTDPIGYSDGMNWYNYVGSDPVNFSDPMGLQMVLCAEGVKVGNFPGDTKCWLEGYTGASAYEIAYFTLANDADGGGGGEQAVNLCSMGNHVIAASDQIGDASLQVGGLGAALVVGGFLSGNSATIKGGVAVFAVAGYMGVTAGAAQFAGGAMQELGGGGWLPFEHGTCGGISCYRSSPVKSSGRPQIWPFSRPYKIRERRYWRGGRYIAERS